MLRLRTFIIPRSTFTIALSLFCVWCAGCSNPARQMEDALGKRVKHALYDETAVNLLQVEVAIERRTVYLSGEVDLYPLKERAEELARSIDGVEDVVNSVQVEP